MKIFILTGAGISAESGVPTFRDSNGLWHEYKIADVATPDGFFRNPDLVNRFYNERRAQLKTVSPNAAHFALGRLQSKFDCTIVTQNVDDLHERGGAEAIHVHGDLHKARCLACNHTFNIEGDIKDGINCPKCNCVELRPHIVWFGEEILFSDDISLVLYNLNKGDVFISIGTSGNVYPASSWAKIAKDKEALTVNCSKDNLSPAIFDLQLLGNATVVVPHVVDLLIEGGAEHLMKNAGL